jgi:predicted ArsR family transcriptional regulator
MLRLGAAAAACVSYSPAQVYRRRFVRLDFHNQFFDSTRGRIVNLLRVGGVTVDDIASRLGLSQNAVRTQLTRMERDGLVTRARMERRTTRPSQVFELTPEAQQLLSKAYIPFLTRLIRLIGARHSEDEFALLMREAGRSLAADYRRRVAETGPLEARLLDASRMLNEEFGAITKVERSDGKIVIRGHGCPLAALTGNHPAVCLAVESLLTELVKAPVKECCTRDEPPRCCFEVRATEVIGKRRGPRR